MSTVTLALRMLRREWRGGELWALALALTIAVTAIAAVGVFAGRIDRGLTLQAGELLAGDLAVRSPRPIPRELEVKAREQGLASARTMSFASVLNRDGAVRLVAVKAVTPTYPLRGRLWVADAPFAGGAPTDRVPAPGQAWIDSRLAAELQLRPGDIVELGRQPLTVTAVLTREPDRSGEFFNVAPRLLINMEDVAATGLVEAGSRVRHQLLLAGDPDAIARFRQWAAPRLEPPVELAGLEEARPELRAALERGRRFLGLAALVAVLVAAVAVAIAARRYSVRRLDGVAVLRCLGAEQRTLVRLHLIQLTVLALAAAGVGILLALGAQAVLSHLLSGLIGGRLPAPDWRSATPALATGLLLAYAFALPPLLALRQVSPARVLRRELAAPTPSAWLVYGLALACVALLAVWQAGDLRLAGLFLAGVALAVALLGASARALLALLRPLRRRVGVDWRFGLANLTRRPRTSTAQILGFGLGIMALLLLTVVRGDLLHDWRTRLPPDAPNHFAINIHGHQLQALQQWFRQRDRSPPELYPMVRGRLVAIDGEPVRGEDFRDPRARRLATREFNLSWSARPQPDNRVVAGRWWSPSEHGEALLSVEAGIAETLGIEIGDRLTYRIAGEDLNARVVNLRSVEWESFHPNFFVIAPPGLLDAYPATWISSFRLESGEKPLLSELVAAFPNVTIIDVQAVMEQVRRIMDRVSLAVEYVFGFTLLAGLVVLYAAVQATRDERLQESALLRALGAGRRRLLAGLAGEFVTIGLLAGLLAALGATALAWVLAAELLEIPFTLRPSWWLIGALAGGIGVGLAGTLGARSVLRVPPMEVLRRF